MIPKNRSLRPFVLAALLCGSSAVSLFAQGPGGPGGPGGHHGPPASPLFDALDTNRDGVLSADEIANASASLKSLLKDGATQLSREDLRPHGPAGPERREAREERREEQRPPAPEEADAPHPPHHPPGVHAHRPPAPDDQMADEQADAPRPHPHGIRPHLPPLPRDEEQAAPAPGRDERPLPPEAQNGPAPRKGPQPEGPDARRPHHGPPASPLFDALDTNRDGVLSDEEIGNAPASLKSLLKDGATQLRREDLRPAPGQPPRPGN